MGKVDLKFPEFSSSKIASLQPDIITIPKDQPNPTYDLILGVDTLSSLGVILDFNDRTVTIDGTTIPMRSKNSLNLKELNLQFKANLEPILTRKASARLEEILDANYEKADLPALVNELGSHLNVDQRNQLLKLLIEYKTLFDGTLGDWDTKPISFELKEGQKPYHARRAFPIPQVHLKTLKKEVDRLCKLGVLKHQPESEWSSNTFIIPKKNKQVRFVSDFREVNKRLVRKPYPIPKISTVLQEREGFPLATQLDLNMGYYTIRLDANAQKNMYDHIALG